MKLTPLCKILPALAALLSAPLLHAVININTAAVPNPFPAVPAVADWSTLTVGTVAAPMTLTSFDSKVIAAANAANINTVLGSSATFSATTGPSANTIARFNTGANTVPAGITFLQTEPTNNDYILLLARLSNATGGPLSAVKIAYDYSKFSETTAATTEEIKGLRAYWSVTGAVGSWQLIPGLSVDTTAAVATPQAISATITLAAPLANAGTMFVLWADQNSDVNPEASYHIDNFAASAGTVPPCTLTGTTANAVRGAGTLPADPADDSVSFTANVTGTGTLSPSGWVIAAPPALAGQAGTYGVDKTLTAPISAFSNGSLQINVIDASDPACTAAVFAVTTSVIGNNTAGSLPILSTVPVAAPWVVADSTRTATQTNPGGTQTDHIIDSEVIDLATLGTVKFSATLDAVAGTGTGFEPVDSFALQLIIDAGAPVSVLGSTDTNNDGRLTGVAGGTELPTAVSTTKSLTFTYFVPDTANNLQIRIIGNSNSANETLRVKNILVETAPDTLFATVVGPVTVDNKGTVSPADDEFSGQADITQAGLTPASTGWHSDETPSRTGLYATANPVTFGPYLVSGGAKTVILTDDVAAISSQPLVFTPPAPAITVSAATNPMRTVNGPGIADDTVSFDVTIAGTNGGPSWTATGGTPAAGAFGLVTFTVPAGIGVTTATVTVADASYPGTTASVTATFSTPGGYLIGQINLGGGPVDLLSEPVVAPDTAWVNDPVARTITMTNGAAVDVVKTITSEPVNLSAVAGAVLFTATLTTRDTSSGFEVDDTFKAELRLDDGVNPVTTVNLILPYDTDGTNLLENDELAVTGGTAAIPTIKTFALSTVIPDNIISAILVISGLDDSANETMIVSNILFAIAPTTIDSDGDGVSDANEVTMGTSPSDPADVLRLSQNPGNPLQIGFPTNATRFYRVYASNDTDGQESTHLAVWKDAGLPTIDGDGNPGSFNITVTPGEPRRFYRLHVMLTDGTTGIGDWPASVP